MLLSVLLLSVALTLRASTIPQHHANPNDINYWKGHVLPRSYTFDANEGWEAVNTTNALQNGRDAGHHNLEARAIKNSKLSRKPKVVLNNKSGKLMGSVTNFLSYMKAFGKEDPVTITWYTGYDLKNPSCWPRTEWAPTDASFACALTLDGWATKPRCFEFLELCNKSNHKCVFVRVVDTCAGCKKDSHHVDLTQSPFIALAGDLGVGKMQVLAREATQPPEHLWNLALWGPKQKAGLPRL